MNMTRRRQWLLVAAFSIVMVPIAVFLGGLLLAGKYAGDGGVFGLISEIYVAALTGHLNALVLLFSPLLLLLIWQLALAAHRLIKTRQQSAAAAGPAQGQ